MEEPVCPICAEFMAYHNPRYPAAICHNCAAGTITDTEGNLVSFHNIDFAGGFVSLHTIVDSVTQNTTIVERNDHICWIKGTKCFADEHRLGGIVIQAVKN